MVLRERLVPDPDPDPMRRNVTEPSERRRTAASDTRQGRARLLAEERVLASAGWCYRCCIGRRIALSPSLFGARVQDTRRKGDVLPDIRRHIRGNARRGPMAPRRRCRVEGAFRVPPAEEHQKTKRGLSSGLPVTSLGLAPHSPGVALGRSQEIAGRDDTCGRPIGTRKLSICAARDRSVAHALLTGRDRATAAGWAWREQRRSHRLPPCPADSAEAS